MYILAMDTTTRAASVALFHNEKLISSARVNTELTHSETLMPMLAETMARAQVTPEQLGGLAVAVGPGSFTGVRIGVTVAKTMCQALKLPVVGLTSLEALAYNLVGNAGLVIPILDARKQQVYTATYEVEQVLREVQGPRALSLEALLEELADTEQPLCFTGDAVPVHHAYISAQLGKRARFATGDKLWPDAVQVGAVAVPLLQQGQDHGWQSLLPYYLRASEAETTLAKKQAACQQ